MVERIKIRYNFNVDNTDHWCIVSVDKQYWDNMSFDERLDYLKNHFFKRASIGYSQLEE
jgi:hypothetical protein